MYEIEISDHPITKVKRRIFISNLTISNENISLGARVDHYVDGVLVSTKGVESYDILVSTFGYYVNSSTGELVEQGTDGAISEVDFLKSIPASSETTVWGNIIGLVSEKISSMDSRNMFD